MILRELTASYSMTNQPSLDRSKAQVASTQNASQAVQAEDTVSISDKAIDRQVASDNIWYQHNFNNISYAEKTAVAKHLYEQGEINLLEMGMMTRNEKLKEALGIPFDPHERVDFLSHQQSYLDFLKTQKPTATNAINMQEGFVAKLVKFNELSEVI